MSLHPAHVRHTRHSITHLPVTLQPVTQTIWAGLLFGVAALALPNSAAALTCPITSAVTLTTADSIDVATVCDIQSTGALDIQSPDGSLDNAGSLSNQAGGTVSNGGLLLNHAGASLANAGILSNTGLLANDGQIDNSGVLDNHPGAALANQGVGTLSNTGTLNNTGDLSNTASIVNAGQINNSGTLTVTGDMGGAGSISGTGTLTQTAGTLTADGVISQAAVNLDGGTLDGTGVVDAALNVDGGTVSPGHGAGTLSVNGNVLFDGTLLTELAGAGLGEFDWLDITGTATLGAGSLLDVRLLPGFTPTQGSSYDILTASAIDGQFGNLLLPMFADMTFSVSYLTGPTGGGLVRLTAVSAPVPLPAAVWLFGSALAGLSVFGRLRKAA